MKEGPSKFLKLIGVILFLLAIIVTVLIVHQIRTDDFLWHKTIKQTVTVLEISVKEQSIPVIYVAFGGDKKQIALLETQGSVHVGQSLVAYFPERFASTATTNPSIHSFLLGSRLLCLAFLVVSLYVIIRKSIGVEIQEPKLKERSS